MTKRFSVLVALSLACAPSLAHAQAPADAPSAGPGANIVDSGVWPTLREGDVVYRDRIIGANERVTVTRVERSRGELCGQSDAGAIVCAPAAEFYDADAIKTRDQVTWVGGALAALAVAVGVAEGLGD